VLIGTTLTVATLTVIKKLSANSASSQQKSATIPASTYKAKAFAALNDKQYDVAIDNFKQAMSVYNKSGDTANTQDMQSQIEFANSAKITQTPLDNGKHYVPENKTVTNSIK
jgi:outer membrane protein assembly factor BamD (BamD/ComL family)